MLKNRLLSGIKTKKIALLGIFTSLALLAFIIESFLPPLFIPGAKLGLSNIFSMLALIILSPFDALLLITARTVLGCIITGNPSAIIYSLSAGLVSLTVSTLLIYGVKKNSLIGVSIAAAVVHNLTQNLIFCLITGTPYMLSLMPYLALLGVLSGAVTGTIVYLVIKKLPMRVFDGLLLSVPSGTQRREIEA